MGSEITEQTLDRRVAVITGASRGIGYAIAEAFAKHGYDLAICGTREETIQKASDMLAATYGVCVKGFVVDVTQADAVKTFIQQVVSDFGRLDVLVNNAGITRDTLALRMKTEDWQVVIDTNLSSVFYASQAALKSLLRAPYGRIINISSVVAAMGNPGQLNYCASKGGIESMTRSLAREIGRKGVTVNAIAPGFIATDMTAELGDAAHARLTDQIPLGRLGQPEDIAAAALFLASENSSYITGQVLHVNGGMYM
ncbi:MAG: 3-oxoacyl-ACP reductase FabG [Zetaproteobacteria bacterium]|nr:3-oxoacyl-ACP reductase FabG [Zetaproteobacteria bacterium]